MDFTIKQCLGVLFGFMSFICLILNLIALISVFRLAFLLRKNQVYVIAFFNILLGVLQMTLATFYLAPTIVLSSFIVSSQKKDTGTMFLSSIFLFLWYFETITQMIMAINRFVVICLQKHNIFTFVSTISIFILLIPFCFATMYNSQYINPCCTLLFDQERLSYSYYTIEGVTNYTDNFELPLNATSSIISAICYLSIFWTVHKATTSVAATNPAHKMRRNRDLKYAIQFCFILLFYVLSWVFFRLFPVLLKNEHVEWFIVIPSFYSIHCTSSAFIYLNFNSEVQNNVRPEKVRSILHSLGLSQGLSQG